MSTLCTSIPIKRVMGLSGTELNSNKMLTQSLPRRRRPLFGGLAAGIEGIASTTAPVIGGVLTDRLGWRWCFWINLPLGGFTFLAIFVFFRNPRSNQHDSLLLNEKMRKLNLFGSPFCSSNNIPGSCTTMGRFNIHLVQ